MRRDQTQFKWYALPCLVVILNELFTLVKERNWNAMLAAFAFFGMDIFNEVWNALYFVKTGYACPWIVNMPSAYVIIIGWNIEIVMTFLLTGIGCTRLISKDRNETILGLNNRHFWAIVLSFAALLVELYLNYCDALVWNFWWWSARNPWLIILNGYLPFFMMAFAVYDMKCIFSKISAVIFIWATSLGAMLYLIKENII